MSKAVVDELVRNMKAAEIVSKVSPWMVEGKTVGEGADKQVNVRFVGLVLKDEWLDIFSVKDNILLKFITDRSSSAVEFYLANATPFVKIITRNFSDGDKWETVLGEVKRRLKRDKQEVVNHTEQVGNIYARVRKYLK
jgi:hypothetical protein